MPDLRSVTRRIEDPWLRLLWGIRRWRFVCRLRLLAAWKGTRLTLSIGPRARIGRRVHVRIAPRSTLTVSIGSSCQIGDDVILALFGGSLTFGPDVQLRQGVVVMLSGGALTLAGSNVISFGCLLHVGESVTMDWGVTMAEYASVADSSHFFSEPDVVVSSNTLTQPVRIGRSTFLAPKAAIGKGVTVGDYVIVGPCSVVAADVESGTFVSGVPARKVRDIELPWAAPAP